MKIILVGYGNVGKELKRALDERGVSVDLIVRSNGIFDETGFKIDENKNLIKYLDADSCVFISVPSVGNGEMASMYYLQASQKGSNVITCEKAYLAHNWDYVRRAGGRIRYSATVGGNSGILNAIKAYPAEIKEIQAVINGTLNYIGQRMGEGAYKEEVYNEVITKGFAEPGSRNFDEVIENELKDVVYKAVIIANHSGLYGCIIKPRDVTLQKYKEGLRCSVFLDKESIRAGFFESEDATWFPTGANNTLFINNTKITEGPGAGGRITAERMLKDFEELRVVFGW